MIKILPICTYKSRELEDSVILRGIDFGPVLVSAGTCGFFGEGYWFHQLWSTLFDLDLCQTIFVSKTTTLGPRAGNMTLKPDRITPLARRPDCIKVYPVKGVVLNAVGLSGPGAIWLLDQGRWQKRTKPFFISFMSLGATAEERLTELEWFVDLLRRYLPGFTAPVGLEINFSCPNVGLDTKELAGEAIGGLKYAGSLGIPLVANFNPLLEITAAKAIAEYCDAISVANTIPWKDLTDRLKIDLFGSPKSPLANYGGGGLSGKPLLPIVVDWVKRARAAGLDKPIVAGGGVLSTKAVDQLKAAGATSVKIATILILRPWRVNRVIEHAQEVFS